MGWGDFLEKEAYLRPQGWRESGPVGRKAKKEPHRHIEPGARWKHDQVGAPDKGVPCSGTWHNV